jgi:uncharacterized small protein (DUF1192 family)
MAKDKESIKISLTREQQEQIRKATGKASVGDTLELSVMELEERIAPGQRMG